MQHRETARFTSVWVERGRWPALPDRPPEARTSANNSPHKFVHSIEASDAARVADLAESLTTTSTPTCFIYRADQTLRTGDVIAVGLALQKAQNSQLLLFPELASDSPAAGE
jgi:hypothetical protein